MLVSEYCRNTREILLSPLKSSCPGSVLQDNPGHATRTRKGRRPQLSESEDGDWAAYTLPQPRPAPSSGQEASVGRSVSVPPRHIDILSNQDLLVTLLQMIVWK